MNNWSIKEWLNYQLITINMWLIQLKGQMNNLYSDIFQSVCDAVVNPIKKICENVVENACLQADAEHDDRINVEEPGTAWIFTCPNKNWLLKSSRCKFLPALMTSNAVGRDSWVNFGLSYFSSKISNKYLSTKCVCVSISSSDANRYF